MRKPGYGPNKSRLVIVGEAWGSEEEIQQRPFVGGAGKELQAWLKMAGITEEPYLTNVINARPWGNKFSEFCLSKKDAQQAYKDWVSILEMEYPEYNWPPHYCWPPIEQSKYLHPKYIGDALVGLAHEIRQREPNLVVACGNKACWALLGKTKISKIRGTVAWSEAIQCKVLPVLHPAAILRNYEQRPLSIVDMMKAAEQMKFPEVVRPERELWLDPDLQALRDFSSYLVKAKEIGCDIETEPSWGFVKMVGFSADDTYGICVPFFDPRQPDGNYWQTPEAEAEAWEFVSWWLNLPQSKIFQNGQYDMTWLWALHGIYPNAWEDTLLQAHALQPELPRDLGTLGSVFTDEPAWKENYREGNKDAA